MLGFKKFTLLTLPLTLLSVLGCATYYDKNIEFQEHFVLGEFAQAAKILDKNKGEAKGRDRLLYFLQQGVVLQLQGSFEESNKYFEDAYLFTEDLQKNYATEAISLLTNPMVKPYRGEDFEAVLIHYYKALNYLRSNQTENALVECRRVNNKLNQINDRYAKRKNRYKRDAFAYNLMGIIFDAVGDHNNAFISYRNALETYQEDYWPLFNVEAPQQLKKDLLRTAYLNGFGDELARYEKAFGFGYVDQKDDGGELIFFWHNGLGPVKAEWSISFFIVNGQGGLVTFVSEEHGLALPFFLGGGSNQSTTLGDLKFVRMAFPRYSERKPYYRTAHVSLGDIEYPLELAQNVNEIAFKTLEDRMVRELSESLLRLAAKQAAEQAVRNQNQGLGALLSIANAISEKADTRNWQTLPYSISYVRVPLPAGESSREFKSYSPRKSRDEVKRLQFNGKKGETAFYMHPSLDSIPIEQ